MLHRMDTERSIIKPTDQKIAQPKPPDIRHDLAKIAKESAISLSGAFVGILINYLLLIVLTRLLSPKEYGTFVLGQSIINTLLVFVMLGTPRLIDRYVPFFNSRGEEGSAKTLIYGVFRIVLIIALFMGLLVYLLSDHVGKSVFSNLQLSHVLAIISTSIPLLAFIQLVSFTFVGFKELRYQGYVEYITYPLLMLSFATIALLGGYGLITWTWMYVFSLFGASCLSCWFLKKHVLGFFKRFSRKAISVKEMISFSWPLSLHTILLIILGQTDSLFLGYFRPPEDVGIYRIYFLLASILAIVHDSIGKIYKPVVSGHAARMEVDSIRDIYQRVSKWSITVNMFLIGLFLTLGNTLVETLFSKNYSLAIGCFYILLCGQFFNSAFGHQGRSLEAFGRVRLMLINSATFVMVTLTLDLILIPRYGIYGAAIANASGLLVTNLLSYAEIYFLYRISLLHAKYIRVFVVLLLLAGLTVGTRFVIGPDAGNVFNILSALGFSILYLIVFSMVVCDENDRWLLKRIYNRIKNLPGAGDIKIS
jgi:O-antigen/teichoic acid export membrane protein